jgi:hypothetical protein
MPLHQEIGNKQHVYFEDNIEINTDFSQCILCITEYFDSVLLTIHDSKSGDVQSLKLCNRLDYKIDTWLDFEYKKVINLPSDIKLNDIPDDYLELITVFNQPQNKQINVSLNTIIVTYAKASNQSDMFYIEKNGDVYLFVLVKSFKVIMINSFEIKSLEELVYHILNAFELNAINRDIIRISFHYNIIELENVFELLESTGLKSDLISIETPKDYSYPFLNERLFINYYFVKCML